MLNPKKINCFKEILMKITTSISFKLMLIILFISLLSCATIQQTQQDMKIPIIDADYFTVEPPYGVWAYQVDKQTGFINVKFEKAKYSVLGAGVGSTLIQVFRNGVKQEGWHLSEEEVADDFRNQEENIMRFERGTKPEHKLKDVKKDITTIGGKKLYRMSYKLTFPYNIREGWKIINAVLYLYFPPEFKENHIFYGFLFSESHPWGALVTFDVELIYPVINSLKIKTD
jgi:hypothetical protein